MTDGTKMASEQSIVVWGDSFVVAGSGGDVTPAGDEGVYVRDVRFLSRLEVLVDGRRPAPLTDAVLSGGRALFHAYVPGGRDNDIDPSIRITRRRIVAGGVHEEIEIANGGTTPRTVHLEVQLGSDFAYIFDVKHGRQLQEHRGGAADGALAIHRPGGVEAVTVRPSVPMEATEGRLATRLTIGPSGSARVCLDVSVLDVYGTTDPNRGCDGFAHPPARPVAAPELPRIRCTDQRFQQLAARSLADLESLVLPDPDATEDRFVAAGSPWFLTMFGRDSLWAALMALPYDLGLARGTLRALARRQGTTVDPDTEEAPGKILHEVRRGSLTDRGDLPPNYYGSIDATPLFVILAHEAWRWGLDPADVEALLPHVEAALQWMPDYGDADGDGFLEYIRSGDRGLANQGWKDSGDAVRFVDGHLAAPPIALVEVQGYAYAAAVRGAELLEAFGRPAEPWRTWAQDLASRFRERFWVADEQGRYPAMALDGDKRPVDAVASNMGHLLFTGILTPEEARLVASRLTRPEMNAGYGLRTLAAGTMGYNPLSYHCGSIWPHDTAIAIWGLGRAGCDVEAGELLSGLLRAAPAFDFSLPELLSGIGRTESPVPVPYPTACRPQAWAAGGALLCLRAVLGADADLPNGYVRLKPLDPAPFGSLELADLPLGDGHVTVTCQGSEVDVSLAGGAGVEVRID